MPINILMPALSPTMEKGNLAKWLKKEGDIVKSGDVLAEIETDKATMEVESIDDGVLAKIVVPDGTADVAVNQLIGVLAGEGEDVAAAVSGAGTAAQGAPAKAEPARAEPTKAQPAKAEAAQAARPAAAPSAPPAAGPAPAAMPVKATGNGAAAHGERIFASPLARRLAREAGIDLALVPGSGPHGRIIERDVAAARAGGARRAPAPAPAAAPVAAPAAAPAPRPIAAAAAGPSDEQTKKLFPPGSFEEIPHDSMRKTIARRLTEAASTVPHFYMTVDCTIDALTRLREEINAAAPKGGDGKPAYKISVNDFVIKALALALARVPDANVSWTEGAMLKHKHVDVGVAVALPGHGLITPIIRQAETRTLSSIANAMKDFAVRAKARKLKPEEYQGGTTAVSNLGMFGIKDFTAVINPPHATILAVGTGEQRAIVRDGALAIATQMSVTLSCDHRAIDGALGAELLGTFRELIEKPMAMLV